jgi:hypothetical protein
LIAVFLQHICSEVNTLKGVVEALTGILEDVLFMRTNAASRGLYVSRTGVGRSTKISEAPYVVDERLVTPNISVIRIFFKGHFWSKAGFNVCVFCALQHIIMPYLRLRCPECPKLLGDYYMGKGAGGRKGPARGWRRLSSMSKRTTRYKQWRWAHSTGGAPEAS